eukprot:CAMPEP_0198288484 /NCGR_PEP_ID=MMETSP1449-20131203/6965_1 /TAXON_ID=420275 /ORGANISM="Attheya septentrionalis, Strain CCMP2084" /LENGTH=587 /DNA_ID=CAMNT_0043986629 /DNA_START=175 /DNA_END=1938 /DNA_ORIENTATION=-
MEWKEGTVTATATAVSDFFEELGICYNSIVETLSKRLHHEHEHEHECTHTGILEMDWKKIVELRAAILRSPLVPIPNTNMHFYPGVPDVEKDGMLRPVVIRPEDYYFWQDCIDKSLSGHRVCGVGNPGIGKSTTSFHLIRELIMTHKRTVVFAVQKHRTVYYEFVPVVANADGQVININVNCHPPNMIPETIPSLQDARSYYVPDPSQTKVSCDVDLDFPANFVMAASNDDRHWGGAEFTKNRGGFAMAASNDDPSHHWGCAGFTKNRGGDPNKLTGTFVYSSSWKEAAMLSAKNYIGLGHLSDGDISDRYRAVGGSVRAIQQYDCNKFQLQVESALSGLREETAKDLAQGICNFAFSPDAPSSVLVSVTPHEADSSFYRLVLSSDLIEEQLAAKFLRMSWFAAVLDEDNSGNRGNLFEAFVREKFSRGPVVLATCRESLSTRPPKARAGTKKNYQAISAGRTLGSQRKIVRVSDMIARVRATTDESEMFYSKNESEPLVDMICRVASGYEATQVTIQVQQDAATEKIQALVDNLNLNETEHLTIVYAVPKLRYNEFSTNPVNPLLDAPELAGKVKILHVAIDDDEQ